MPMDPQAQEAIEKALLEIEAGIRALDIATDPAKREVLRKAIAKHTALLRKLVKELVAAGAGPNPKGVVAKALAKIGIHVGKASAAPVAEAAASGLSKFFGYLVSAVAIVLTSPSEISGFDRKVVHEFILYVGETCFRIQFVKTKGTDEQIWYPPRIEWEEVPCPAGPEPVDP